MNNNQAKQLIKELIVRAMKRSSINENGTAAKDLPTLLKMAKAAGKGQLQRPQGIRQLPPTEPNMGAGVAVAAASSNRGMAGGNSQFPQSVAQSHARLGPGAVQMFTDGRELWYGMGSWYIRAAELVQPETSTEMPTS